MFLMHEWAEKLGCTRRELMVHVSSSDIVDYCAYRKVRNNPGKLGQKPNMVENMKAALNRLAAMHGC